MPPMSYSERIVSCIKEVEYIDFDVPIIPTILDACGDTIRSLIRVFGHSSGGTNSSIFNLNAFNDVLRKGGAPRYLSAENALPILSDPLLVNNTDLMGLCLGTFGMDQSSSNAISDLLQTNPFLYYMILDGNSYSILSPPITYVNLTGASIYNVIGYRNDDRFVNDLINVLGLFILISNGFTKRPIFNLDNKAVDRFINSFAG